MTSINRLFSRVSSCWRCCRSLLEERLPLLFCMLMILTLIFWGLEELQSRLLSFRILAYSSSLDSSWICYYLWRRISALFLMSSSISPRQRSQTVDNLSSDQTFHFSAFLTSSKTLSSAYNWFSLNIVCFSKRSLLDSCSSVQALTISCLSLTIYDLRCEISYQCRSFQWIRSSSCSSLAYSCRISVDYSCQCRAQTFFMACQNHCMLDLPSPYSACTFYCKDVIQSRAEDRIDYSCSLLAHYSSPILSIVSRSRFS